MKKYLLLAFCLLTTLSLQAADLFNNKPKFLPVDQAFQLHAEQQHENILLNWQIIDNYYLYQDKLEFSLNGQPIDVQPQFLTTAEQYQDPYFGTVNIFKHQLALKLPLPNKGVQDLLDVTYQGCTQGFCYPPETKQFTLSDIPQNAMTAPMEAKRQQSAAGNSDVLSSQQNQLADSLFQSKYAMLWFFVLGIGLAFSKQVALLHGGRLTLLNPDQGGACVELTVALKSK